MSERASKPSTERAATERAETERSETAATTAVDAIRLLRATQAAQHAGEGAEEWLSQLQMAAEWTLTDQSLDALLLNGLRAIRQAIGSDAVAVLLANEAGDALVSRVAVGLVEQVSSGVGIRAGAGIAGRVLASAQTLIVDDIMQVEVASPLLRQSDVRSMVAVPMTVSGRVIGVVHAASTRPSQFSASDAAVLQVVADRLAGAVERVRLFEAERSARAAAELLADRLARLQHLTAALSSRLDSEQVAEIVLAEISSEPTVVSTGMWLLDEDRCRLRLLRATGAQDGAQDGAEDMAPLFSEQALDSALPGPTTARTGEPLYVSSPAERDARFPELAGSSGPPVFSVLPLRAEDAVLGVLSVGFSAPQVFEYGEGPFLVAVAEQAAQALERARLRHAEARVADQLAFLAEAATIFAASLDEAETLAGVARLMVPRVADLATVHLYDESRSLRRVALAHRDPAVEAQMLAYVDEREYEVRSAVLTIGALRGEPLFLRNAGPVMRQHIALDREHARILEGLRVRSAIAVPLSARGEVFGMLSLLRVDESEPYKDSDVGLATELGRRAATAIDNSRLHRQRAELARTLQQSLLPPTLPSIPGLELAASYHPAGQGVEVGGDFYDVFNIDPTRWALAIGDVCGSGAPAAALTAQVRYTVRAVARTGLAPADVIQAVNAALIETIDDERFCTMIYGEIRPGDGCVELELVSAGHPLPLVVRAAGAVDELDCRGQLLGVMPVVICRSVRLRLEIGDAMVFVTDGVLEARSVDPDEAGRRALFGSDRLRDALVAAAGHPAAGLVHAVDQAVLSFANGRFDDDAAVLAVRALPAP